LAAVVTRILYKVLPFSGAAGVIEKLLEVTGVGGADIFTQVVKLSNESWSDPLQEVSAVFVVIDVASIGTVNET
jgi:spore maturation protein SpmB